MRAREFGRWVGRLVVVAVFGVALAGAGVAAASTDEPDQSWDTGDDPSVVTPDDVSWN